MAWEPDPDERAEMEEERRERNRLKKVWNALPDDACMDAGAADGWRERLESDPDGLSEDECLEAVRWDGFLLESLPMDKRTEKVCAAAVESAWEALEWVPGGLKTPEFCAAAAEAAAAAGAGTEEGGEFMRLVPEGVRRDVLRLLEERSGEDLQPQLFSRP